MINLLKRLLTRIATFALGRKRRVIPFLYLVLILLGVVLSIIGSLSGTLEVCLKMFGNEICAPLGVYIILIASIPGYLIVGNLLPFLSEIQWFYSMILVVIISFIFYFLSGYSIDKFRRAKNFRKKTEIFVIASFIILLLIFIALYMRNVA
jgi:hypothetical protein